MQSAIDSIKNSANNAWENIKNGLQSAMSDLKSGISSAFNDITNMFNGLGDKITSAIANIDLAAIGTNIVKGIADGVSGGLQFLINALDATIEEAIQWVKDFLGIESPSKLFAGFGLNTMQGMAIGIESGSNLPKQALDNNLNNLIQGNASTVTTNNVNNTRNIDLQINNNGTGNPDTTYFDVIAAFEAVGV